MQNALILVLIGAAIGFMFILVCMNRRRDLNSVNVCCTVQYMYNSTQALFVAICATLDAVFDALIRSQNSPELLVDNSNTHEHKRRRGLTDTAVYLASLFGSLPTAMASTEPFETLRIVFSYSFPCFYRRFSISLKRSIEQAAPTATHGSRKEHVGTDMYTNGYGYSNRVRQIPAAAGVIRPENKKGCSLIL